MKPDRTARIIRHHYRGHLRHFREQMAHLFLLYRICEQMRSHLGERAFGQWLAVNCPEMDWKKMKPLFDQVKRERIQQDLTVKFSAG